MRGCKAIWVAMAVVFASPAVHCGESGCATGLLMPPHRRWSERIPDAAESSRVRAKRLLSASDIPAQWDSRDRYTDGVCWIGPVKNQNPHDTCWAFAALETLETQMRRLGKGEWDFSEKNMVNLSGYDVLLEKGVLSGYDDLAEAYLLRWEGAVAEENDEYPAAWSSSVPRNPPVHVQKVVWIPGEDVDELKQAIMEYGAVAVSMYHENNSSYLKGGAYYYSKKTTPNHAVTVIGWDDAYPTNNFKSTPPGNGAWIVKNSHGKDSGDGGYLYVSYFDGSFFKYDGTVYIPATRDEDYTAVYGYDRCGPTAYGIDGDSCPIGAIFTASSNEELAAIGLYSYLYPIDYSVSIYTNVAKNAAAPTNGALACTQSGTLEDAGYSTIHLDKPIKLAPGSDFSIVFTCETQCDRYFAVCADVLLEYVRDKYVTNVTDKIRGRTFFQPDGSGWIDSTTSSSELTWGGDPIPGNICLKAYTRTTLDAKDSGPSETVDGTAMCSDMAAENPAFYAQTARTFGAFANIVGDNRRTSWYSWLTGLDPADPSDTDFSLAITFTNSVPYLSWFPDLGKRRTYTIYAANSLTNAEWQTIEKPAIPDFRFFRVEVAE